MNKHEPFDVIEKLHLKNMLKCRLCGDVFASEAGTMTIHRCGNFHGEPEVHVTKLMEHRA